MTTTIGVKMADDSDIPPLEDMTDVLQKAELIREVRFGSSHQSQVTSKSQTEDAKKRAKVTKKTATDTPTTKTPETQEKTKNEKQEKKVDNVKSPSSGGQGLFGGMKKGFLFGGPSKQSSTNAKTNVKQSQGQLTSEKKSSAPKVTPNEDIPYIKPTGETESGLGFNEVQQAMSEAKGLLDNQEWITDDFLSKIEKHDTLLKRFSDPKFMAALQEFQTNPQAAMEKYKGNQEVEQFLMEFCGLLGDHFTKLGSSGENSQATQKQSAKPPQPGVIPKRNSEQPLQSTTPKIVEIGSGDDDGGCSSITVNNPTAEPNKSSAKTESPDIRIHDSQNGADIQEIPRHQQEVQQTDDASVREVLNDPKVMETLMDPKVMALIKTLREDPAKGQRIIDKADLDLKEKVRFLVARGLLQFQMS